MNPLEFEHELRARLLLLRQNLNRSAQCMNYHSIALQRKCDALISHIERVKVGEQRPIGG